MSGSCWGSDEAEEEIEPPASGTPEVEECTAGCPCDAFVRYNDPFAANYTITNCGGLAARLRNKWGNLRMGQTGTFRGSGGVAIDCVMTVDGLRAAARAAGKFVDRGADITSPAPASKCDILFALWVLRPNQWGIHLADKAGVAVQTLPPNAGEDFHIVSARLDKDGVVPADVYSTNGQRPFEGPKTMSEWAFVTGTPMTNQPDNDEQYIGLSAPLSDAADAFRDTNVPLGAVPLAADGSVAGSFHPALFYYRLEVYNNDPTPEAFIIDDAFMRTFTSSR